MNAMNNGQGWIRSTLPVLRARRGRLTQAALARATGIAQSTISALERGRSQGIDFATLARLCRYFGCQPGDLLELAEDGPAPRARASGAPAGADPAGDWGKRYAEGTIGLAFQDAGLGAARVAAALGISPYTTQELASYMLPRGAAASAAWYADLAYIANHLQVHKGKLDALLQDGLQKFSPGTQD